MSNTINLYEWLDCYADRESANTVLTNALAWSAFALERSIEADAELFEAERIFSMNRHSSETKALEELLAMSYAEEHALTAMDILADAEVGVQAATTARNQVFSILLP